jgi:hypothetical protein
VIGGNFAGVSLDPCRFQDDAAAWIGDDLTQTRIEVSK